MLITFQNLGIELNRVDVGRFSGVAEFTLQDDGATIERILLDPTGGFGPAVILTRGMMFGHGSIIFNMLSAALFSKYASDFMQAVAVQRSDAAKLVVVK